MNVSYDYNKKADTVFTVSAFLLSSLSNPPIIP